MRKIAGRRTEVSFDEPLSSDWDGNELLLSDILGTEPDSVMRPLEDDVDRALLLRARFPGCRRERQIISMRFGIDLPEAMTQKEVADRLGISQSYISRLEKRIIAKNAPRYRLADLIDTQKIYPVKATARQRIK